MSDFAFCHACADAYTFHADAYPGACTRSWYQDTRSLRTEMRVSWNQHARTEGGEGGEEEEEEEIKAEGESADSTGPETFFNSGWEVRALQTKTLTQRL